MTTEPTVESPSPSADERPPILTMGGVTGAERQHITVNERPFELRLPDELTLRERGRLSALSQRVSSVLEADPDAEIPQGAEAVATSALEEIVLMLTLGLGAATFTLRPGEPDEEVVPAVELIHEGNRLAIMNLFTTASALSMHGDTVRRMVLAAGVMAPRAATIPTTSAQPSPDSIASTGPPPRPAATG